MARTGALVVAVALTLPSRMLHADDADEAEDAIDGDVVVDVTADPEAVLQPADVRPHDYPEPCPIRDGVVGYRRCPVYGTWAAEWPYAMVTFGFNLRHMPRARTSDVKAYAARGVTPPTPDAVGSDTSYTLSEQIGIAPNEISYFAFEVEFSVSGADASEPDAPVFGAASHLVFGLHGGTQTLRLGAELAGGIRLVDTVQSASEQGVLEARARADLWASPWLTIGAMVGTSLLDRGDWVMGLSLGTHSLAFGGR